MTCECGKDVTHVVMDSEVGPECVCSDCAEVARLSGNVHDATVFVVQEIKRPEYPEAKE